MKLLALDIDGVLNSYEDHMQLSHAVTNGLPMPPNIMYYDRGNWVDAVKLNKLKAIITPEITVIGISSWFSNVRMNRDKISKFLGINISAVTRNTGGGQGRVDTFEELVKTIRPTHIAVLDDQSDWGIFSYCHVQPLREGLTDLNIEELEFLLEL